MVKYHVGDFDRKGSLPSLLYFIGKIWRCCYTFGR